MVHEHEAASGHVRPSRAPVYVTMRSLQPAGHRTSPSCARQSFAPAARGGAHSEPPSQPVVLGSSSPQARTEVENVGASSIGVTVALQTPPCALPPVAVNHEATGSGGFDRHTFGVSVTG